MSYFRSSYNTLSEIIIGGKYLGEGLKSIPDDKDKPMVTRIVYGVLERRVELEYYLSCLAPKKPKNSIKIVLEIGLYCLRYMDSLPDWAVCDNAVKLVKEIGKSGAAAFVNATLKRAIHATFPMPQDKTERLSIETSTPLWITKKIVKQYKDKAQGILSFRPSTKGHIRVNGLKTTKEQIEKIFVGEKVDYERTDSGFYVSDSETVKKLFRDGMITYQSESSMKIAELVSETNPKTVLDVCSAPGGKSIYIYELTKAKVVAGELHPHRVELIKSYATRMGANIEPVVRDGLVFNKGEEGFYDCVLLDAPCSGIGTRYTKPDVLGNRQESDIPEFAKTQEDLLAVSARYVKSGGS